MKLRWWRWWRWPRWPRRGASLPATNVLLRHRLGIRGELLLALVPTAVVLAVLAVVEAIGRQRVLFALRIGAVNDLALFGFALIMTATLVVLNWVARWLLAHLE